ncbi:MAG: ABC transporter permease [Methylococcaceae bacterium]
MIKSIQKNTSSSIAITFSVWKALFLREALSRLFSGRAAWMWLLFEPMIHIAVMLAMFATIRVRNIGGIDTTAWLMSGMLCYFMFKRSSSQVMNAISANQALFTYRQVKPVDTALVRAFFEGILTIVATLILFALVALFGVYMIPTSPMLVFAAFLGLWLIGLGFGLIVSVAKELIPELGRIIAILMTPLYMLSGVMMPLTTIPLPYRDLLMFNPLLHGVEAARLGFAPYYHAIPNLSIAYVYVFALTLIFFGLLLHKRFAIKLVMR